MDTIGVATLTAPRTPVRQKAKAQTVELREDFFRSGQPHKVDREAGIIYGVKVLGWESPNRHGIEGVDGTVYDRDAVTQAMRLYEGTVVNKNHPPRDKPSQERVVADRIGWLANVRIADGGLYADLHLLKSDPDAAKIFEAAESNPALFGMSHNATGKWEVREGKAYIVEIPDVRSVDLVTEGGTTRSLFESRETRKKAIRQIQGTKAGRPAGQSRLAECEDEKETPVMDDMAPDSAMAPAPMASDGRGMLAQAVGLLAQSMDADDHDLAAKIMKLLKPEAPEEAAPVAEDEGMDDKSDEDKKDMDAKESRELKNENARLKRELVVVQECAAAQVSLTPVRRKALLSLTEAAERQELISSWKGKSGSQSGARSASPASGAPVTLKNFIN
jgi:hypothetical protein